MAHFAQVKDGIVTRIYVVANDVLKNDDGIEVEELGREFLAGLYGEPADSFVQCSYNGSFRGRYPSAGYSYDSVNDRFLRPRPPGEDWILDDNSGEWVQVV